MEPNVEKINGISVVKFQFTHLDASNSEEAEHWLTPVLEQESRILLDMQEVEFLDSSGVGVLLYCIRKIKEAEGTLRICCPSEPVRMAFDLVRLNRLVDICDSRAEAIAAFEAKPDSETRQP